ncbi:MAG: hypothetical protein ACOYD4_04900 [Solirubrobacterales bacterium]
MTDRLREYLDRPLDPAAGRAAVLLAAAIFAGVAAVIILAGGEGSTASRPPRAAAQRPAAPPPRSGADVGSIPPTPPHRRRRQDPQDEAGTAAARRAARELRVHRALQHVPYRRGGLRVELVGAAGGRAVLQISAPSIAAARAGWRRFLRRYRDRGDAYRVRFLAARSGHRRQISRQGGRTSGVASPVASLLASPGASLLAITSRRSPRDRRRSAAGGASILPTSLPHSGAWT